MVQEIKTNYPPGGCPKNLEIFLHSIYDDIMHAPLNCIHSNLPVAEREGGVQLVAAQRARQITIKPVDKGRCASWTQWTINTIEDLAAPTRFPVARGSGP